MMISYDYVFFAVCSYEERMIPKGAGFKWNPNLKRWETGNKQIAFELVGYADDRAKKEIGLDEKRLAESYAKDSTFMPPASEGLSYLPYQRAGIEYMVKYGIVLLADEPGLGKTIQIAGYINSDESIKKVLVFCPATLKLNWKLELDRWIVRDLQVSCNVADPCDVLVVSYDSAWRDLYRRSIVSHHYDLVVLDEAHACKNESAKRSAFALEMAYSAQRKVLMTGTPVLNRPIELFPLLCSLKLWNPKEKLAYAKSYCDAFLRTIFTRGGRRKEVWDFNGASNTQHLNAMLRQHCMIRRLKKEVLPQLPEKTRQIIQVPAGGASSYVKREVQQWGSLCKEYGYEQVLTEGFDDSGIPPILMEKMAEIRHQVADMKTNFVIDHIKESLESIDKIVVFAHHKSVVDRLMDGLIDYNPVKIVGGMTDRAKQESVDQFQTDPKVRVFVGNTKAAGVGITLTAAHTVVFAELDYTPGIMTQAEDRCLRIGQKNNVLVQHIVMENSLDVRIAKKLIRKQETIDAILK